MSILLPIIAVTVVGLVCAVMLVAASKAMALPPDENFKAIRECLPGANCGACGYAGCDGYARGLADGKETRTNLCTPGGEPAAKTIASVLGVEAGEVIEQVAYVACCGNSDCTTQKYDYYGIESCAAANLLFAGDSACSHGCLGYGDCVNVCPNGAICIVDGLAQVRPDLCSGCGLCARACPNNLIKIVPDTIKTIVRCCNTDKGAITRAACTKGCIGCKKCEKECPVGAITVKNNCASIDYAACNNCGHCVEICPSKCIMSVDLTSITKAQAKA